RWRMGWLSRDGAEPVPGGPARRRPDRLRALRPAPPHHRQGDGLGAAPLRRGLVPVVLPRQRRRLVHRAGFVAELVRMGGLDLVPRRVPPHAAPRRPFAALAGPPPGRYRLSGPARPDAPPRHPPPPPRRPFAPPAGPPPGRYRLSGPARPDAPARHPPLAARAGAAPAREVGPPAATRPSSKKPTTKKRPTATIAARWLPERSHDTRPNTTGPSTAPVFPTRA